MAERVAVAPGRIDRDGRGGRSLEKDRVGRFGGRRRLWGGNAQLVHTDGRI